MTSEWIIRLELEIGYCFRPAAPLETASCSLRKRREHGHQLAAAPPGRLQTAPRPTIASEPSVDAPSGDRTERGPAIART